MDGCWPLRLFVLGLLFVDLCVGLLLAMLCVWLVVVGCGCFKRWGYGLWFVGMGIRMSVTGYNAQKGSMGETRGS
jgi:hypothetical protein